MSCSAPCAGVEILDELAFTRYADEWDRLLQRSYDNRIFYRAAWHRIWWEHFGRGEPRVITIRDERGRLQAVLPLQIVESSGDRILTLLGDWNVSDYMDGLAEKPQALALLLALWNCALSDLSWDRIELRHVPSSSPLLPALRGAAERSEFEVTETADEVCPVAILCSSWEGYLQMLSKKQRHEVRRKLRRAQEDVEWNWRTASSQADVERDLPVFFALHEASAGEKAGFMTDTMRSYFAALASSLLDEGMLRFSVFSRAGADVAATMSFLYRDRYLLYNSGYDPAQSLHSPGIAAAIHAMQDAIEEKAVAFDFLSGDEPYKYQLGATNTYTSRVTVARRR